MSFEQPYPYQLNTDHAWTRRAEGLVQPHDASVDSLVQAAKDGDAQKIRALVEAGADVDHADANGWTPLFWTIKNRHIKAAAELVTAGARVNREARNGWTPLSLAVKSGSPLIITLITQACGVKA